MDSGARKVASHTDALKGSSRVPVPRWGGLRDEPKERLSERLHQKKPPVYPKYIESNVSWLSPDGFIFLSTVS